MVRDEYGLILSETSPPPGCYGDSMAETARWLVLTGETSDELYHFVTPTGYVRHPKSPWREDAMVTDQLLPFYLAAPPELRVKIKDDVRVAGWRTGNGTFVSPMFYGVLVGSPTLTALALLGQAAIFKVPFRWSDSKKAFESSAESSADYLNWFMALIWLYQQSRWLSRLVMRTVSAERLIERVRHYYRPEPRAEQLIELYEKRVGQLYGNA